MIIIEPEKLVFNVKAVFWYLRRPRLYRELLRKLFSKLSHRQFGAATKQQADDWAEKYAIDTTEAIRLIRGAPMPESVKDKYKDVFTHAEAFARECPVEMGGPGDLDLLYWVAEHLKAQRIVETGVAYGWSSLVLLLSLANRRDGCLISTDKPYVNRNNDEYVGCVVPALLRSFWEIVRGADRDVLPKVLERSGPIDMCHYDSDKSYEGRMWTYHRLWKSLRSGGCFISDDIGDNIAFKDFCNQISTSPIIVKTPTGAGAKYVGVLIKDR
jgi:predicted O-methyltransferase YrrM